MKRIEARRDIHKRCDEIVRKAVKLKQIYPKVKFGAVIYYPFIDEHQYRTRRSRSVDPSRWGRTLFSSRRILVKARERLSENERDRVERALAADPSGELRAAWILKEGFRDWYLASGPEEARVGLERWYLQVEHAGIGEFAEFARTVKAWESELLAHFPSGATNGATEGITNLIKVVKRQGFGYRNFENFRLRVLYRCG